MTNDGNHGYKTYNTCIEKTKNQSKQLNNIKTILSF